MVERKYTRLAQSLSILFAPSFMPLYGSLGFFLGMSGEVVDSTVVTLDFFSLCWLIGIGVIPSVCIYIAYRTGRVGSVDLSQQERRIVLPIIIVWCFLATYCTDTFKLISAPLIVALWATSIVFVVSWLFNFFLKVSLHTTGLSSVTGYFFFTWLKYGYTTMCWLGIFGLLCTAVIMYTRLYLHAHSFREVWAGLFMGLAVTLGACFVING